MWLTNYNDEIQSPVCHTVIMYQSVHTLTYRKEWTLNKKLKSNYSILAFKPSLTISINEGLLQSVTTSPGF